LGVRVPTPDSQAVTYAVILECLPDIDEVVQLFHDADVVLAESLLSWQAPQEIDGLALSRGGTANQENDIQLLRVFFARTAHGSVAGGEALDQRCQHVVLVRKAVGETSYSYGEKPVTH
jgi:hypothetical protein